MKRLGLVTVGAFLILVLSLVFSEHFSQRNSVRGTSARGAVPVEPGGDVRPPGSEPGDLVASTRVRGRCVDVLTRRPVVATVHVGDVEGVAGEDGRFQVLVPVGMSRHIRLDATGYDPCLLELAGATDVGDVELQPIPLLRGRVLLDDGSPAVGCSVRLLVDQEVREEATADQRGEFQVGITLDSSFRWGVTAPIFALEAWQHSFVPALVQVDRLDEPVEIRLRKGEPFVLRVLDSVSGSVIAGAAVSLRRSLRMDTSWALGTTDGSGQFLLLEFETKFMGWVVFVEADGYWGALVRPESGVGQLDIELARTRAVRGVVLDEAGQAVRNATVWADPQRQPRRMWGLCPSKQRSTEDDGTFAVDVPVGLAFAVKAQAKEGAASNEYASAPETPIQLVLRSEGATDEGNLFEVQVMTPWGDPAVGATVSFQQWPPQRNMGPSWMGARRTDADGIARFRIASHISREVRFLARLDNLVALSKDASYTTDLPNQRTVLHLRKGLTLVGVLDAPSDGVQVAAWSVDGNGRASRVSECSTVAPNGRFALTSVPPGELVVAAWGKQVLSDLHEHHASESDTRLDVGSVRLFDAQPLRVSARSPTNKALARVSLECVPARLPEVYSGILSMSGETGDDGCFVFPNRPRERCTVVARVGLVSPVSVEANVEPDAPTVSFVLEAE